MCRYGAALALGVACAGTGLKEAIALLETLSNDPVSYVRQGALIASALVLVQQNDQTCSRVAHFRQLYAKVTTSLLLFVVFCLVTESIAFTTAAPASTYWQRLLRMAKSIQFDLKFLINKSVNQSWSHKEHNYFKVELIISSYCYKYKAVRQSVNDRPDDDVWIMAQYSIWNEKNTICTTLLTGRTAIYCPSFCFDAIFVYVCGYRW